jgi:hypothetical protein
MMMRMLEAGGMAVLIDYQRQADPDNLRGYYELERVKKLREGDVGWLDEAEGKAVKVISALLEYLPPERSYRVIFMRRRMGEILASQREMLVRRGEDPDKIDDRVMATLFEKHLRQVEALLKERQCFQTCMIDYNALIESPGEWIKQVTDELSLNLDVARMAGVVEKDLYRQRGGTR